MKGSIHDTNDSLQSMRCSYQAALVASGLSRSVSSPAWLDLLLLAFCSFGSLPFAPGLSLRPESTCHCIPGQLKYGRCRALSLCRAIPQTACADSPVTNAGTISFLPST